MIEDLKKDKSEVKFLRRMLPHK